MSLSYIRSPSRAEAMALSMKPTPVYSKGVLLGNWVEDRIECPKQGTFYFPPKHEIEYTKSTPESRTQDLRHNRLSSIEGNVNTVIKQDSFEKCGNFATTTDLVYNHLPKPLCGPNLRSYKKSTHMYYPHQDLLKCYGNITEWGLKKYMEHEWKCSKESDYINSVYDDTYVAPKPGEYLHRCQRKARDSSFTKSFRYTMTKS